MNIKTVGVVGSGTMGGGIGLLAALSGYETIIIDIEQKYLDRCKARNQQFTDKSVEKGKMSEGTQKDVLGKIKYSLDYNDLKDCDAVIEAVIEEMELKQQVITKIENVVSKDTLMATNTSSLSIIDIAAVLKDASRLVGIHFFNPAPLMKLCEIVKTVVTDEGVLDRAVNFAQSMGKKTIVAKDVPGFIVNYLQYPFRLHAIRMVEQGLATPEEIDAAAKYGLGHPMGPLELQDMVGLDVTLKATAAVYDETKEKAFAPPVLLKKMVAAGKLGRKAGEGFYKYE